MDGSSFPTTLVDQLQIRDLVDGWMMWRDQRNWEKVAELWHPDGKLMTTWGGYTTTDEFAAAAQKGFEQGDQLLHSNGGTVVQVSGDRGVSQTKLRIMQRAEVEGVLCDVVCIGRDYDFVERRDGKWGFVLRQAIYERDWLTPVDPSETVTLDPERLARFPDGYARLAYVQESAGYPIVDNMPTHTGREVEALYAAGETWLRGGPLEWPPDWLLPIARDS